MVHIISVYNKELNAIIYNQTVVERFQKKQIENENLLNVLLEYSDSRSNVLACEDRPCDMRYIAEHENYRRSYLYHLHKYRRLKDKFFNNTQNRFTILRIE